MFPEFNLYRSLTTLPGILLGFTFHEYAHAYAATRFGDPTPENQGRLTLNPIAHIDIWGLLLIIVAGFGWAKPVQTNPSYYKGNVRGKDMAVSVVGPAANLMIAVICAAAIVIFSRAGAFGGISRNAAQVLFDILNEAVWINCALFVFNLVPIPPLDGYHILANLLPWSITRYLYRIERYGSIILMIFVISNLSGKLLGSGAGFIYDGIFRILGV